MIHFLEQNFVELVTITSMIYLILAVILFLFKTPDTKVYKPFRRSKSLMAGGMLLISLNIWIWIASFTGSWTKYNNWVPCFDIILFYLMGICFSFSLSSLLDPHYISRKRCKVIAVKFVMTAFFALIAMTDALKDYQIPLLLIALLGLLEMLIGHIYYFNRCYLRSNALFENYFSNDKNHFIRWLKVSHWLFYGMLILGVISIRTGALINWLVQFYVVAMNFYILINIINYASEYETLMKANCDEEKTEEEEVAEKEKNGEISPKKAYIEKLRPRVAEWIQVITAKPKAHAFKNEMCFPLTKTKCELKKHSNLLFGCFFNDFNRTKTSLFLPFPSKLIQDNLVCVLELQE